ncbi:hypothetical protein CDEST_01673 [Colletotrichum destructivum]|uniref:Uncharacterized protein n=1 Tax=Colletotrichum destructivum TaxID=34406 RepID=A0AAX4I0Z4_9PEZI|nr:hypothetical protein CDEST_01673 [Colletotrichum destructivum]
MGAEPESSAGTGPTIGRTRCWGSAGGDVLFWSGAGWRFFFSEVLFCFAEWGAWLFSSFCHWCVMYPWHFWKAGPVKGEGENPQTVTVSQIPNCWGNRHLPRRGSQGPKACFGGTWGEAWYPYMLIRSKR